MALDNRGGSDRAAHGPSGFKELRRSRVSDQLAAEIQSAIASERYKRGERLPSEHELATAFGTSRGTVREALRILEATGFVEIRTGAGAFVAESPLSSDALRERFQWLVDRWDTIIEMLEVREGLQGIAARGCAARAGEQGGEALREWLLKGAAAERDGDVDAFAAADGGFHFAIGERCGNRMLGEMVSYVEEIYRMSNRVLVDLGHRVEVSQREHQRVVECIVAGDGDGAESAMRDHIRGVRAAMAPLVSEQVET